MIIELNKENIKEIKNSFLSIEEVQKEWKNNPFAKYLVYKEENQIIGYLYYSDIYERAEINQFEIEVMHRNCGKGLALLQKMIEIVDKDISLEVRKDNLPAIHLYQKCGFVKKALRKGYYQGVDGILMERKKEKEEKQDS